MPICNKLEYSENYPKTSESLWHYCRDQPDDDYSSAPYKVRWNHNFKKKNLQAVPQKQEVNL